MILVALTLMLSSYINSYRDLVMLGSNKIGHQIPTKKEEEHVKIISKKKNAREGDDKRRKRENKGELNTKTKHTVSPG